MDKLKILVVDDESRMRKLVKDFLVKRNFEVLEAENGADAIDVFFSEKDIALVILDEFSCNICTCSILIHTCSCIRSFRSSIYIGR